ICCAATNADQKQPSSARSQSSEGVGHAINCSMVKSSCYFADLREIAYRVRRIRFAHARVLQSPDRANRLEWRNSRSAFILRLDCHSDVQQIWYEHAFKADLCDRCIAGLVWLENVGNQHRVERIKDRSKVLKHR